MFSGMPEKSRKKFKEHQIPAEKADKLPLAMVRSVPKRGKFGNPGSGLRYMVGVFQFSNSYLGEYILAIINI